MQLSCMLEAKQAAGLCGVQELLAIKALETPLEQVGAALPHMLRCFALSARF